MYDANGGETARVEDVSGNQAINSHVGDYSVPQEAAPNAPIILEDAAAFVPPHSAEFDQATTQHGPIVEHNGDHLGTMRFSVIAIGRRR